MGFKYSHHPIPPQPLGLMSTRTLRVVPTTEWVLGDAIVDRHSRLLNVPVPDMLLLDVINQASVAARVGHLRLQWEPATESTGYFRLLAQVPLEEVTFDQFFNGRSGYRAQFYLSPEEGVLYNRDVLQGLRTAVASAYSQQPLSVSVDIMLRSLDGPHSKIWVFDEKAAFDETPRHSLTPPRWVKNNGDRGLRAPLPKHLMIDIKGVFIHSTSGNLFIDDYKLDRSCDLYTKGYT